jgi:hypothetical protein
VNWKTIKDLSEGAECLETGYKPEINFFRTITIYFEATRNNLKGIYLAPYKKD